MFLVRHGESEFNQAFRKTRRDPGIIDPPLTFLGIQQIQQTADFFRDKDIQFCVSVLTSERFRLVRSYLI